MSDQTCCGQGGSWTREGDALKAGCLLCPNNNAGYWRTHRADGKPYEPHTVEQSYPTAPR